MNYIVLDLEWNQALPGAARVTEPVCLVGEIVQMGAVKLDGDRKLLDRFDTLVRPRYYTKMQAHVRELTGLEESRLQKAPRFPEALKQFLDWCGEAFSFVVWGGNDLRILRDNLQLHGLDESWLPACYDLQKIYGRQFEEERRAYSLAAAAERLALPDEARNFHDAGSDAYCTALVLQRVDWERAMAEASTPEPSEGGAILREVFQGYPTRNAVWQDRTVTRTRCPVCGRRLVQTNWASQPGQKWIMLGSCREHGGFFVRVRLSRDGQGWSAVRLIYPATGENRAYYQDRAEKRKARRRKGPVFQENAKQDA